MAKNFTDAELRQVAEYVARRYLEVERGLRGKECLQSLLSSEAYTKQFDAAASRFGKGGVVRQTDLGRMSFQRPEVDRVHIAIPARQEGGYWGALVMELRANDRGAWRVTELTRAQDRNLTHAQPVPQWKAEGDPDRAVVELARVTAAARAARTATAERYAQARQELAHVAPEKPAGELQRGDLINANVMQRQQWAEVRSIAVDQATGDVNLRVTDGTSLRLPAEYPVSVLAMRKGQVDTTLQDAAIAADRLRAAAEEMAGWDHQLALLEHGRDGLDQRHRARHVDEAVARSIPPNYVTRTLGLPPEHPAARELWEAAASAIETYRDRWGITRTDCALGRQPREPKQRKARDATITTLRELTSRLAAAGRDRDDGRGQRLAAEHDEVDRAPFAATIPAGQP